MVDPWIALAAVAMRTERIRLGATVTQIVEPYREAGAAWWVEFEASRAEADHGPAKGQVRPAGRPAPGPQR